MSKKRQKTPYYQSFSLSEKYDSRNGFTEIDGIYNDNGDEQIFSEIIEGYPNYLDLNERLENDFLSSPLDKKNNTFFSENDMIRVKRRKSSKRKSIKRKSSKNRK